MWPSQGHGHSGGEPVPYPDMGPESSPRTLLAGANPLFIPSGEGGNPQEESKVLVLQAEFRSWNDPNDDGGTPWIPPYGRNDRFADDGYAKVSFCERNRPAL